MPSTERDPFLRARKPSVRHPGSRLILVPRCRQTGDWTRQQRRRQRGGWLVAPAAPCPAAEDVGTVPKTAAGTTAYA